MIAMYLSELLEPLAASLHGDDCLISELQTDSRQAMQQALFVALSGEQFDGHNFAAAAIAQGAIALMVERLLPVDCPQLLVKGAPPAVQ